MRKSINVLAIGLALMLACLAQAAADPGYDFTAVDLATGDKWSFEELVGDKPLVVHFWSIDCPYCLRHMPYFAAFYKRADLDQATIVTLSVGGKQEDVEAYIAKKELVFPVLWRANSEGFGDDLVNPGMPNTFVFNAKGELVGTTDTTGPSYITEVFDLIDKASEG